MKRLAAFSIFADHYVFYVHDSQAEACPESFLEIDSAKAKYFGSYEVGYLSNGKTISYGGCAHLNNYWIELFLCTSIPEFNMAQRVTALPLDVSSGRVCVSNNLSIEPICTVALPPNQYVAYCLGFSLGKDQGSEFPGNIELRTLSDSELAARLDYEHYHIVFVPQEKGTVKYGVVHGAPDIATAAMS